MTRLRGLYEWLREWIIVIAIGAGGIAATVAVVVLIQSDWYERVIGTGRGLVIWICLAAASACAWWRLWRKDGRR